MPSTKNGGNIKFGIDFEANQASLNKLKKSLQDLQKIKFGNFDGNKQEFDEVKSRISEIQDLVRNAFNPTLNTSNITAFKSELEKSGMSLKQIQSDFSRFGLTGDRAFNQLATSVLTTNLKLKETNSLIDNMGRTMVNTVKWGIASSVMNTFTQSVQGAFQYVQSLEKSLTNIRIVTGDSTEKMAQFAEQANRSAQALGRSTLDYSKASLTFYQQGLNDEDVQARTEATLKAQNITGAGSQMADYLTAVWNGYKVANEEAEVYVDKLAAVADSSASDMSQLAIAMSKVASTANTMGVDVDQLNAQIATVVATTRQAPESVGTAFKTIYTRMNDIKAGSDEAEISLGRYSGKMAELGFNVLDATGNLRDTGQVMEEIGDRWEDLTREQQVYLAQTMGGQRQVNQLMALFDNWTTYSELLNTSLESEGTLAEKNSRYMESLGAKMEQLGAAGERVKDALIDSDSMKTVIEALTSVTNLVANLFETMGSGQTILLALGSTMTQLFSGTIAKEINNVIVNMQNMKTNAQTIKNQLEMTKMVQDVGKDTKGGILVADRMAEIQQYYSVMDEASINNQKNLIRERAQLQNNIQTINQERGEVERIAKLLDKNTILDWSATQGDSFENINVALGNIETSLREVKELSSKDLFTGIFDSNATTESTFITSFNKFIEDYKKIDTTKANELAQAFSKFTSNQMSGGAFFNKLNTALDEANQKTKELSETIGKSGQALSDATNKAETLDKAIKDGADSAKQLFDVTNVVKMISAIGQISSSLMTIKNLKTIWDDKDVSTGEKIAKTVSTMAFVVPSLVTAAKNLKVSTFDTVKAEGLKLTALKLQTKEKEKQLAFDKLMKLEADPQSTLAQRQAAEATFKSLSQQVQKLKVEGASSLTILKTGLTSFLGPLTSMLPILLGIGVAVAAIYGAYKEWNKEADAAKKASEIAADTKKTYDDLKTSLQDVKSALEDLHNAENNLDGLTKGTQEWRDALQQCNDKVLELISNYPELAQYVTNQNGQLKLSADGEQAYLDQLQAGVQNARNASYIASSNSREANVRAAAADIGHNSFYTDQNNVQAGRQYASAEQVKTVVQAIDKVIGEGADLTGGLNGLTDKIVDQTGQSEELVKAILSNEDAVLQLRTQLQQNETADKLMYETMAQGALADNSTFKGMDELGQQVASAIGGADLKEATEKAYNQWIDRMSGARMDRFDSASDVSDILEALNKAQGTNWRMDSNAVRGGEANRTLAFVEEDGKTLHEFTRQQIASTIAAKQALEDLGVSAEDASKVLASIDSKVSDTAKDAVKQWASGQDMTSLTRNGLGDLQGQNLTDIFNEDELKSLAKVRNIDIEQTGWQDKLQQDWDKSLQYISSAFDNVAKDASNTVQTAFSNIKNNDSIKNASLEFQQMVVEDMQKAFDKGGKNSLDQISKLYGEQIQDFEKFDSVIKDFDFSKGAIALGDALKEAGAATDISTQALQAYIKIQQQQAKTLSPEGTYAAVHEVTDKVKKRGDKIDANQAAVLTEAGVNVDSFFVRLLDGSYKLITSIDAFQQHVNNVTVQPFKAKMTELQAQIDGIHTFENGAYSSKNMDIEEFSSAAGNITNITGTDAQVVTGQDTDKLRAQVEFLKIVGEEDRAIAQAEEAINQKRTLGAEYLQRISTLIKEHANDYEDLSEVEKQLLQEMGTVQEAISNTLKPPLDQDVKEEDWENLTQHLEDYADQIEGVSAQLKDNAKVSGDVAEAILRYDSALGKVKKNFDGWLESLSSDSIADHAQIAEELQNVYSDLLDLPFDNVLSDDFLQNVDNLNLLKQAANGSEQAYDELLQKAQQDIQGKVSLDNTQFWNAKDEVTNAMDEMNFQDIQIGADLDTGNFISQLQNMVNAAGMSAEQATDYLASMGIDAEVEEIDSSDTETKQSTGYTANLIPHTQYGTFPAYPEGAVAPTQVDTTYTTYSQEVSPQKQVSEDLKENKAFTLKVKSAHKSSGGGFKYRNASAGNKGGSGKGGGKKGGGGGGGKAKEPNKAKGATNKADRYRNNTVKANKLANSMTKLQKQQEKLTGKDSLKNLQKQLQILEKQNDTIRERIGLQRDEQSELANNLKKFGATFDKDGTLNNYFKVHAKIMQQYNNQVAKWNQMSADQQQKNKDMLNNAKEVMDNALKDLQRYDKLQQEIAKSIQQQIDNAQEQIDLQAKQFELKITAELDLSEAKRDWNKFRRDLIDEVRDDDILGLNKYRFADISSYFNNIGTGSIQYLTDRLKELTGTPDGSGIFSADYLNETLKNMTVTDRQARLEQIKKVMDDLQGQMEDFKSLADDIKKSIFDTIDATQDAFDQQMDEYEYIGDLINHNMKVTELLFGDQAYDRMTKYYDRIEENNNNQLDFLAKEKDLWYSRMMEEQARMAQLNPNTNAYKQAEDRFKQYQKHWMDSVNDLNGKIEDALDNIIDKYANAISNIFLNFDLSLGGGRALNDISDEWDMLNDLADTYLDKINSAYEIEKLQNAFDDAIDDNEGNIAAQESLNNLMEQQLAYLKDKEKLTQYDVDRANTLLQIEMKRLALEQSRNNKNRLRLRRDSQGNYTYQYTADTEAMNKAEQELADAKNSLYNSDKAAYVDNLSAIQKSANDIKDKLEDIWKDENLSKEQKLQKSYELQKYYGQKINDLIAENTSIRNNLMESGFEELAKMYDITPDQFMAMSKEQQDAIFKDLIPQANSYAAQMVENIAGAGGMATFFQNLLGPLVQSYDNRVASISAIEEKSKTNFENIVNDTDILIGQAEQLLDNNDKLVGSQEEQLNLLQSQLNVVSQMLQKYEAYKSAISDAVESGYNELNNANASIVGTTRAREDAATAAQMKQLENNMNATTSAWDIKNYTPYTPQWSGSDFAALFGSANIIPLTQQNGKVIQELGDVVPTLSNLNTNTLFGTIDNNIFNSINSVLNNILETSQEYYATSLAKQDAIRQAVVANQTIHIDADFPNAKDVRNIIEAIEGLANAAAQRANTKGI